MHVGQASQIIMIRSFFLRRHHVGLRFLSAVNPPPPRPPSSPSPSPTSLPIQVVPNLKPNETARFYVHPISQMVLQCLQERYRIFLIQYGLSPSLVVYRDGTFSLTGYATNTWPSSASPGDLQISTCYRNRRHYLNASVKAPPNEPNPRLEFILQDNNNPKPLASVSTSGMSWSHQQQQQQQQGRLKTIVDDALREVIKMVHRNEDMLAASQTTTTLPDDNGGGDGMQPRT